MLRCSVQRQPKSVFDGEGAMTAFSITEHRKMVARFLLLVAAGFLLLGVGPSARSETPTPRVRESKPWVKMERNVVYGDESEPMHRGDIYVRGDLAKDSSSRLPAVIVIHGGAWTLGDKVNDTIHAKRLAERGYWVMSINYRLAPAHPFPSQLEDCKRALDWVVKNAESLRVDPDRLGVWGYSAGGHLAALLALQKEESKPAIKVCVSGGTPFDLSLIPKHTQTLKAVFGGTPAEVPDIYKKASPIEYVNSESPPIFLFHGEKDWLVPTLFSDVMKQKLRECGVEHEFVEVPGKGHLTTFVDMQIAEQSFCFMDEHLQPDSAWPLPQKKPQ
ncbi:Carboxylesterase NlhH [Pirellula sp. SH-Sr6A]|nr:Carboxylesterase NlhH [Pirellula sp. SH-Sr6A]